jgi:hypothetical protein
MASGGLDGYAVIQGNDLSQLHIQANWQMEVDVDGIAGPSFNAALDAKAYGLHAGEDAPCNAPEGAGGFEVIISAYDVGANILGQQTRFDEIYTGFVLAESDGAGSYYAPVGLSGGVFMSSPLDFQTFELYEFGLDMSLGLQEVYLGAYGQGAFDGRPMGMSLFAGRTCDDANVARIDPTSADLLPFAGGEPFTGIYLRGELTAPFMAYGCLLDVSFRGSAGSWLTVEPVLETGGIVGGAALGEIACIGSVRGQIDTAASIDIEGNAFFSGRAFAVGGAGFDCDRGTWTSARRSRGDDYCGTGDVSTDVEYRNGEWKHSVDKPSAVH